MSAQGNYFAHEARQRGDVETNNTTAHPRQGTLETGITSAPENCTKNTHFSPAKATGVSDSQTAWSARPSCAAGGRWRGPDRHQNNAPNNVSDPAPLVRRAPEGPQGLAAVPVGGGEARTGTKTTRQTTSATRPHWCGGRRRDRRAWLRRLWAAAEPDQAIQSDPAPLVRRAPEGPEGTGGLRGAAPNEVRSPSLAGGRALRRPEHQRGHKQQHAAAENLSRHRTTRSRPAPSGPGGTHVRRQLS